MARGPMAGVSGPGKFSKRTDGLEFESTEYGSKVQYQENKAGAPLAKTADVAGASASNIRAAAAGAPVTPLYAPTQRPDEPITAGVDIGEGPGSEIMGMGPAPEDDTNFRATIRAYMPVLAYISSLPNTSPETRRAIRQLRDNL
jgi:hypothetical protein